MGLGVVGVQEGALAMTRSGLGGRSCKPGGFIAGGGFGG